MKYLLHILNLIWVTNYYIENYVFMKLIIYTLNLMDCFSTYF